MRVVGLLLLLSAVLVAGQFGGGGDVDPDECVCVKYFQCVNNTVITKAGRKLIEVRLGGCPNSSVEVCCKIPDVRTTGQGKTPAPPTDTGAETDTDTDTGAPITPGTCGRANPAGVDFTLIGAQDGETNYGEFPWTVALLRRERVPDTDVVLNAYECGGSLIHLQVVLTAAHCVHPLKLSEIAIRAGEWDTQTTNEPFVHQERNVRKVIIHEGYDDDTLFNDIALLILEQPVTIDEHINVVCLPDLGEIFDHTRCFSGGWGKDVFGKEGVWAAILKKRELPVVPQRACEQALRTARLGPFYELDDSFICAGGERGIDTCKGDGGSPLVCPLINDPLHFKQAGIVAWGLGCGEEVPGVYANVAIRRDWIDQKMTSNGFDTSSYTYSKQNL